MKILYVEDDQLLRESIQECFGVLKEEYPQLEAIIRESATEAIALLRVEVFDVVISDYNLGPGEFNGGDVANLAAQRGMQKVILNSGNTEQVSRDGLFSNVEVRDKMRVSEIMDLVSMTAKKLVLQA